MATIKHLMSDTVPNATKAWYLALANIMNKGQEAKPRGQTTLEVLHDNHIKVDMNWPVVAAVERKLNYKFMAAEALWITEGRNDLASLTPYVPRMAQFSDDGVTLAGAYGPRIQPQLSYVIETLLNDPWSRQATLTIWAPNPAPSKDIPCTISMTFSLRNDLLHCHAHMRSSDIWLGVPYDIFSFSMVSAMICCDLNLARLAKSRSAKPYGLGTLTISPTSSHLYQNNYDAAWEILRSTNFAMHDTSPMPEELIHTGNWGQLKAAFKGRIFNDEVVINATWNMVQTRGRHDNAK